MLTNLGIDEAFLNGKHGACPLCGGNDRFRFDRKREMAFCSGCGHKSPLDLAIAYLGRPFRETAAEIRQILGVTTMEPIKQVDDYEKNKARLFEIYGGRKSINGPNIVEYYLASRGLTSRPEQDVFYHPNVTYYEDGKRVGTFPAMVSVFRNVARETATYHITYLTTEGQKAAVSSPKKILPTIRQLAGCSIQLFAPKNEVLAIAEGIETALAVHQLEGLPVWAAGNAQLMEAIQIPVNINEVWIYADRDPSFTGQKSAYTLARRLTNEGKKVMVCNLIDQTWITDRGDKYDFLDFLAQKGRSATIPRS
ncbi:MAG: toprim domain-containing protein [Methylobacter sp.]|nr:toprim domain-containing protein [Methylobacter sp.]